MLLLHVSSMKLGKAHKAKRFLRFLFTTPVSGLLSSVSGLLSSTVLTGIQVVCDRIHINTIPWIPCCSPDKHDSSHQKQSCRL